MDDEALAPSGEPMQRPEHLLRRVAVVGGGPGGLFFAALLRRRQPDLEVVVFERNRREDAFGFGVVFSDATLRNIDAVDAVLRDGLRDFGVHWTRIEVWSDGERHGFDGNGMAAIHRKTLLLLLQRNAEEAGAELRFETLAPPLEELRSQFDVVVGSDGTNSAVRQALEAESPLGHGVDTAKAKFIWFGTTHHFDGLTFVHRVSEHGNFAAHAYPISDELSTFIVETDEATWRRAGLDAFDVAQPPGPSDVDTQRYLEELFAPDLQGHGLVANNSRWSNFRTRRTDRWWRDDVVLLGDAVHTAHFSVGSGTKMAMEDAIALADELSGVAVGATDLAGALASYQARSQASVARIQDAAGPSLSWWEHFGTYQQHLEPLTFAFHFFSRSIGIDRIATRDPRLADQVREAWVRREGQPALDSRVDLPASGETVTTRRRLVLRGLAGSSATLVDEDGAEVVLPAVHAGETPGSLPAAIGSDADAVAVIGPASLTRTLLAEEARLVRNLVTVVVGDDMADDVVAETTLLAGRADAVASLGLDPAAPEPAAPGRADLAGERR